VLFALQPNSAQQLAYHQIPAQRLEDHFISQFDVPNHHLFLFLVAGYSHESDVPFEVTYAVYNGEVINLPENDLMYLVGTTVIFSDGTRKMLD